MFALFLITSVMATASPIEKVVGMLTDMQNQLNTEKKEDEALHERMACWCTTNNNEKDAAVKTANRQISELTSAIDEGTAKSASLKASIAKLVKSIAKNNEALAKSDGLRNKENGEFTDEETELSDSLGSVSSAVSTLSKHNSFLQTSSTTASTASLRHVLQKAKLSAKDHATVMSFLQQPAGFNSYNSRSGAIFGILSQMKETFTTNLASARTDEAHAVSEFAALSKAKGREISASSQMKMDQTQEMAETDEDLANNKHDLELTRKALSADTAFIMDLQERCATADKDYADRTKARGEEIVAVGETIGILTDDASRDMFSATYSFIQIQESSLNRSIRVRAARLLENTGKRTGSTVLLALAAETKLDAFVKVQEEIDAMVKSLTKEMKDEVAHRDFCVDELTANKNSQSDKTNSVSDLEAEMADLNSSIDTLAKEIADLNAQVAEMNIQVKRASEDREAANKDFQQTVSDQRATKAILEKATARLEKVYEKKEKTEDSAPMEETVPAAFVQLAQNQPEQKSYSKNDSGGGVMGLLQEIIGEADRMESDANLSEQDEQDAYQNFVKDTSKSIKNAQRSITMKQEEKATKESAAVTAKSSHKADSKALMNLKKYNAELHSSCDYVMKNFGARQEARGQEIDSLGQAKAILNGAGAA